VDFSVHIEGFPKIKNENENENEIEN